MSLLDISLWTGMITVVQSQKPIFGFEYHQITNAILKFRDFFTTNRERYAIPQSLITELNGYISKFPTIKFGDIYNIPYQNDVVEALRIICELVQYSPTDPENGDENGEEETTATLLYRAAWYVSPLLVRGYTGWKAGHFENYRYGTYVPTFWPHPWRLITWGGAVGGLWMGTYEQWFMMMRQYEKVEIHLRARLNGGVVGQPSISIYYLTSGQPEPLLPIHGKEAITTRGDVSIKASAHFNWDGVSEEKEWYHTINVNGFINYIVVALRDDFSDKAYWTQINELSA